MSDWFETWFDSKYYHILYKDRDHSEAERFITNLIQHLQPKKEALFLDLACGKGRHSIHLNQLGFKVEGCDYSPNSIDFAKQYENKSLRFYEHDMRQPLPKSYDYILNLFTSFGYFETEIEHISTLVSIYNALNEGGTFVFDFLNVQYVSDNLLAKENTIKSGIDFEIKRKIENHQIVKNISFVDQDYRYNFSEKVMAFTKAELLEMMHKVGFIVKESFGDYNLSPFEDRSSKRLILVLSK